MEASALSAPAGLGRGSFTSPWLRLRTDEQLVGLFRAGSEEAFGVIHDRYRQRLLGYARQMLGSAADAEDVMQDVFLRAYRALRVDERPVSLRAWLYRVAHNRCIDALRRPLPAPAEIFDATRRPCADTGAEYERRADLQRLVEDVRRLPEQQRSALLMREMDGMSYADLAAALDTSVPAVKSLLVRARVGLVEALEARDADCADIRHDLAASYDRGVRTSGRARRHLRDCDTCTRYRAQLRAVRQGFASISPSPTAGILAKLAGLGSAGSGAAAGGAAAGSGTGAAIGGGAAVAASVTKVAAIVCCAAALTGGAVEATTPRGHARTAPAHGGATVAPAATAPATGVTGIHARRVTPAAGERSRSRAVHAAPAPAAGLRDPKATEVNGSGGAVAPAGLLGATVGDVPTVVGTVDPTTDPTAVTDPVVLGADGSTTGSSTPSPGTGTSDPSSPATSDPTAGTASSDGSSTAGGSSGSSTSSSTGSGTTASTGTSGTSSPRPTA